MNATASLTELGMVRVGIIGFGRFGRFIARILKSKFKDVHIVVFSRKRKKFGLSGGIEFVSLDEVCNSDVVVPCVPVSSFAEVIKMISSKVRAGALLLDVCSVKVYPVAVMKKYIPANVWILATHPVFGPDSTKGGMKGLKIVLHRVRIPKVKFDKVKHSCWDIGLEVIEMSPEEHDKLAAYSLAYTHLIGRVGEKINIGNTSIDTKGFAQLLKVQGYVINDAFSLFKDMHNYNPYTRVMRQQVCQALIELGEELDSG
ncbi:prephenate dehydrogenase/arogenate dehydrogenase family protein [Chloroflexota bacterium]